MSCPHSITHGGERDHLSRRQHKSFDDNVDINSEKVRLGVIFDQVSHYSSFPSWLIAFKTERLKTHADVNPGRSNALLRLSAFAGIISEPRDGCSVGAV